MISDRIKKIPKHIWILLAIIIIGIFLRTYNFREWLYFYPDQARDITVVEEVVEQDGEWPDYGPIAARQKFQLGPMYYYFQIISGHIFGVSPETMAYPDVIFSILSIPLLYYFLSCYFSRNLTLVLSALYTVSFFIIQYSRFAWNPNSVPFFILLFLSSAWKILVERKKTSWWWVLALGASIGIGVQLHTWLLLLMPSTIFILSISFVFKKSMPLDYKKIMAIIFIVLFLNLPQIRAEVKNDFPNTRYFTELFTSSSEKGKKNLTQFLKLDVLDHSQANAHIISSLGPRTDFKFSSMIAKALKDKRWESEEYATVGAIITCVIFTVFGYAALIYFFYKEKDRQKKYFLGLVLLYASLSAIVMHFVIDTLSLRYFIHLFFLPFIFLGFLVKLIKEKAGRYFFPAELALFVFLAGANFYTIFGEAEAHIKKNRSHERYVVLGEIEPMIEYVISNSPEENLIYFFAQGKYFQNYSKQFKYLLAQRNYGIEKDCDIESFPSGKKIFMIWHDSSYDPSEYLQNHRIIVQKDFGKAGIYQLVEK